MADGKNTIVIYRDWKNIFDKLTDDEAGKLIKHLFAYINDENPRSDRLIELVFEPIKLTLKRDLKHWESVIEKRSLAGKASAEKRQQSSTNSTHVDSVQQSSTNSTDSDSVIDSVIDTDKEVILKEKSSRFIPPTIDEVKIYCLERQNSVDPEKWYNFYKAKNWMIGKNKMKDWRAAVHTWEKSNKNQNGTNYEKQERRVDNGKGYDNGKFDNVVIH